MKKLKDKLISNSGFYTPASPRAAMEIAELIFYFSVSARSSAAAAA
jgi:hypothetical protein